MYSEIFEELNKIDEGMLVEMAIINPNLCNNSTIQVEVEQRDEGEIPHIHVFHNHNRNPKECSYVSLDVPEYSPHHAIVKMPSNVKKEFLKIMNSKWEHIYMTDKDGNPHEANGYQAAVLIWSETFENNDLSKFKLDENGLIIPLDYSNL